MFHYQSTPAVVSSSASNTASAAAGVPFGEPQMTATATNRLNGHADKKVSAAPIKKDLQVPAVEIGECTIELIGDTPLLVHKFSEKARKQIEEKQQKGASKPREKRDPDADFFGAMYIIDGDPTKDKAGAPSSKCKAIHGIPASGFKRAMVRASKAAGAKMTDTQCAFFIRGYENSVYVKLDFDKVVRHDAMVRLESGVADVRYRPEYHGWSTTLHIEFDAAAMPLAQLVNLLRRAGMFIGWGEDRVERGGMHGRFKVGRVVDLGSRSE